MHNADPDGTQLPTLLFLHGMGTGAKAWQPQIEAFSADYRVLAPNLPGYGTEPGPFKFDHAVEMTAELLRNNGAAPAHICGLSLGALVALELARRHPELINSLILSAGFVAIPTEIRAAREASADTLRNLDQATFNQQVLPGLTADVPEPYRAQALGDIQSLTPDAVADLMALNFDATKWISQLAMPTLVLCGDRDEINLPLSRHLAASLPNGRFEVIPDAGHVANLDAPEAFNKAVRQALSG